MASDDTLFVRPRIAFPLRLQRDRAQLMRKALIDFKAHTEDVFEITHEEVNGNEQMDDSNQSLYLLFATFHVLLEDTRKGKFKETKIAERMSEDVLYESFQRHAKTYTEEKSLSYIDYTFVSNHDEELKIWRRRYRTAAIELEDTLRKHAKHVDKSLARLVLVGRIVKYNNVLYRRIYRSLASLNSGTTVGALDMVPTSEQVKNALYVYSYSVELNQNTPQEWMNAQKRKDEHIPIDRDQPLHEIMKEIKTSIHYNWLDLYMEAYMEEEGLTRIKGDKVEELEKEFMTETDRWIKFYKKHWKKAAEKDYFLDLPDCDSDDDEEEMDISEGGTLDEEVLAAAVRTVVEDIAGAVAEQIARAIVSEPTTSSACTIESPTCGDVQMEPERAEDQKNTPDNSG